MPKRCNPFFSVAAISSVNVPLLSVYLLITPLVIVLYAYAVQRLRAQFVGIVGYTEIISTTFFGFLFLNEVPQWYTFVGGIFIVAGGFFIGRELK